MRVLAIDTATTDLVTGVVDAGPGLDHEDPKVFDGVIPDTRAHNERLVPTIGTLLADAHLTYADLDAVVVGCGPGPFTGLRVGMATGQAIAQALSIPCYGVCSHDAMAAQVFAAVSEETRTVLVATDARRKEMYFAVYQRDGDSTFARVMGPSVARPEDAADAMAGCPDIDAVFIPEQLGDRLPAGLREHVVGEVTPRAKQLVEVADFSAEPQPLEPIYLRRPDAKEPPAVRSSVALTSRDQRSSGADGAAE